MTMNGRNSRTGAEYRKKAAEHLRAARQTKDRQLRRSHEDIAEGFKDLAMWEDIAKVPKHVAENRRRAAQQSDPLDET